jgi:CDP-paratose 2-epimerase
VEICERITGRPMQWTREDTPRTGDHMWWISGLEEFRRDYPEWGLTYDLQGLLTEIHEQNADRWTPVTEGR